MKPSGTNKPLYQNEAFRIAMFDPEFSQAEPKLYLTKWWDYRFLHPTEATRLFAEEYRLAKLFYLKRRIDSKTVERSREARPMDIGDKKLNKKFVTGFGRARQMADFHGVEYGFWCFAAMKYAEKNLWRRVPNPDQLYTDLLNEEHADFKVSMLTFILDSWKESLLQCPRVAKLSFYTSQEYIKHPYQRAYIQYLKLALMRSPHPALVVSELVYGKEILTEQVIRMMLGERAESILAESRLFNQKED